MEKISIIIPAYNEEKRIKETLNSNLKFFKNLKKRKILDFEIIAVVNGSKDRTIEIVKGFAKKNKELRYLNLKRGAKGYAVIEGFKEALKGKSNLIGFKDAQCGAKLFKRKALEKTIPILTFSQLAFDVEILYIMKKLGFKIKEVPTIWSDKEYSKVNFAKSGPGMLFAIIRLRILNSPFKGLIKFYDGFVNGIIKTE